MDQTDEARFRDFATAQAPGLRRSAYLLCGDWHLAEDMMQNALVRMYRSWSRIDSDVPLGNYARKVLLRVWLDERRKPWRRRERGSDTVPDIADVAPGPAEHAQRDWARAVVQRGLRELPPRQRATLVLRYFDELSVSETAEILGCSEGTVKSQTARGLDALGRVLGPHQPDVKGMVTT